MQLAEVMTLLEQLGSEQTKNIFINQGAKEPLYGVKIGDLKKLVKEVKKDQDLALALYETGNSDAMYLAGLTVNPKTISKESLQRWAQLTNWHMIAEFTVAGVAAESPYALELAREWMQSEEELIADCGWGTYANYISITADEKLDLEEIRKLLNQVETTIHTEKNRVRYTMNSFVIIVGMYMIELHDEALRIAEKIGKVNVYMGQTACKVPLAAEYIGKISHTTKLGVKKKTCIC